jgi:hypothetical protein
MSRKTVDIEDLKAKVNDQLLHSFDHNTSGRSAVAALLSSILHNAGQYKGFNYLTPEMMKMSINGTTIGINHDKPETEKFVDTDGTRVFYY